MPARCWPPGTGAGTAAEQAKSRQQATLVAGMSTSPGRGGLLAAIRSRFTALHPPRPCNCARSAGTTRPPGSPTARSTWPSSGSRCPTPSATSGSWWRKNRAWSRWPTATRWPARTPIELADLLDEPFLALPAERRAASGLLAGHRRPRRQAAADRRRDRQHRGDLRGAGRRARRVPAGCRERAPDTLGGVTTRPVRGISPSQLALAWRAGDTPPARPGLRPRLPAGRQADLRPRHPAAERRVVTGHCGQGIPLHDVPSTRRGTPRCSPASGRRRAVHCCRERSPVRLAALLRIDAWRRARPGRDRRLRHRSCLPA